jgi:hypothetical protein
MVSTSIRAEPRASRAEQDIFLLVAREWQKVPVAHLLGSARLGPFARDHALLVANPAIRSRSCRGSMGLGINLGISDKSINRSMLLPMVMLPYFYSLRCHEGY